ncbi:ArsB/NhaD family transporter [Metallosphaera hakonensis]|uniref:ArsB/NhaD family transporter n=1 Tax=Metallosphaera hakonensis TaxID=79601 RepID=UPI0006D1729A|nr:ArsB/NhaD family transporter [Metallosphaera hakonensis]
MQNLTYLIISIVIFIITLFLVIVKPRNLPIGYSALFGALLTVVLGISTFGTIEVVWNITWNATFTFISIIVMTLILDEAGFFEYASQRISNIAHGDLRRFVVLIMLLEAGISAIFANDGAALVMTPIIIHFFKTK